MKQVMQSYRTGELWLVDVPAPACGPGQVLVRTACSVVSAGTERGMLALARAGLLGKARLRPDLVRHVVRKLRVEGLRSTVEQVRARLETPVSLGYAAAGRVVEAGRGVDLQPGDRVAIAGAGYAAHAEINATPRHLCARIPDRVSDTDAAFATLGAIALQGVRQAQPLLGERVAVIGLGVIGLLTVQILKANGCAVLGIDPDAERTGRALALGADNAVSDSATDACDVFTGGRGADAVIITAAAPDNGPIEQAAALSRCKGRVVAVGNVGLRVPREPFYRKELDLRLSMSYGPGRYDPDYEERGHDYPFGYVRFTEQRNLESFLYLVEQGRVTPSALVTHRVPFDDALRAYALIDGASQAVAGDAPGRPLGVVLDYRQDVSLERTVTRHARVAAGGDKVLGVGVIGAGRFAAGVLLPRLKAAGVRLTGVCARTGASASRAAERFDAGFATTDPERLMEDERTAAIVIATRHASHAALAAASLRAGRHVFVEKPLAITETELLEIDQALEEAHGTGRQPCLTVGFNRRFSPHAQALRAAFGSRRAPLAIFYRINAGRLPRNHWLHDPREGGRIVGECGHFVDFCAAVTDSEPVAVTAAALPSLPRSDAPPESAVLTTRYADGSLAVIEYLADGHPGLGKERCELFAGGRSAVLDDYRTTTFHGGGRPVRGRQAKGITEELRAFLDVCRNGGRWPISWASLVSTHRVCFAALRSIETGVSVPVAPGDVGPLSVR